jgi:hypothetical protein
MFLTLLSAAILGGAPSGRTAGKNFAARPFLRIPAPTELALPWSSAPLLQEG